MNIDEMIEKIDETLDPLEELLNNMVLDSILKSDDEQLDAIRLCLKMINRLQRTMNESVKSMDNINEKLDTLLEIQKA